MPKVLLSDARRLRIVASEHWKDEPEAQDFPAARSYLSLMVGPVAAAKLKIPALIFGFNAHLITTHPR